MKPRFLMTAVKAGVDSDNEDDYYVCECVRRCLYLNLRSNRRVYGSLYKCAGSKRILQRKCLWRCSHAQLYLHDIVGGA